MKAHHHLPRATLSALVVSAALVACSGGRTADTDPPPSQSNPDMGLPNLECDMPEVLTRTGCTNNGCHGAQNVAGLDLLSEGVAARTVGVPSVTEACSGTPLINPEDPSGSLLLALVDPDRAIPCSVSMPFGAPGVAEDDVACFESWVDTLIAEAPAGPDPSGPGLDPATPETIAAKVKALASGAPLTNEELTIASEGTAGLQTLLDSWMATPGFERSVKDFLVVELQQRIKGLIGLQFLTRNVDPLAANLEEMMLRTAWRIVDGGQPFHRILTTRHWEVTTAILVGLRYTDEPQTGGVRLRFSDARLEAEDYADWRVIELRDARPGEVLVDFREVATLRQIQARLALRIPRLGYFSSPAFLANAETNDDNQFRVTTNQTLITALGRDFIVADATEQPSLAGLDQEHSDPDSTCYACHRLLDPMRLFFQREYGIFYRRSATPPSEAPSFAFDGVQGQGSGMLDFAAALANHPRFASAWALKLCQWAVSRECDANDPEIVRVAQAFAASNFDFRTLARELLSSPLVTGASVTDMYQARPFVVSITRQAHLCRILDARLGTDDICADPTLEPVLGLVPDDDFTRGKVARVQTALTSAFHFAGTEQLCARLAMLVVSPERPSVADYPPSDPDVAIRNMVEQLMGLPSAHSRHGAALAALEAHREGALDAGATPLSALRSAFVVACQSPDLMGLGL